MLVKYHWGVCVFGAGQRSEQTLLLSSLPSVSISVVKPGRTRADPCVLDGLTDLIEAEYIVVS